METNKKSHKSKAKRRAKLQKIVALTIAILMLLSTLLVYVGIFI